MGIPKISFCVLARYIECFLICYRFCKEGVFMSKNPCVPFHWECQPEAELLLLRFLDDCCHANSFIKNFDVTLRKETSTRLFDWVDHFVVGYDDAVESALEECGFESGLAAPDYRVFYHPGAKLPSVLLKDRAEGVQGVAVSVESIADFLMVRGMTGLIDGSPDSGYRRCCVSTDRGVSLWVVERRGSRVMEPTEWDRALWLRYHQWMERWQTRPRTLLDEDEAMQRTLNLAEEIAESIGADLAAWLVLFCERKYWQSRNKAAQIQKGRQDRLGMGWANHDHHAFRSSRQNFTSLVRLFEILGFHCRERFYAGEEAGWGTQVVENRNCGLSLFLDVDLAPHEIEIDFAHHELPPLEKQGTLGLWCSLHGDSILRAGLHHIAGHFDFWGLTNDLALEGIGMMAPFSDESYLKQAFTEGEVWQVDQRTVKKLVRKRVITQKEADAFLERGAIGSHIENLQRREGYKGFSKKNVSLIIRKTDPRTIQTSLV